MHRELIRDIPAGKNHPRVTIYFEPATKLFVTIVEMQLPDLIKLGLRGRSISEVIEINGLGVPPWAKSRIKLVEEKIILRKGPLPKRVEPQLETKVRTLIYSR